MVHSLLLSTGAIVGIVIGVVVVLLAVAVFGWWISTRNAFVVLKNKVEEAWGTIDVYLQKRFDLIPNLVETVKGYAKHESETLEKVVLARNVGVNARTADEKMQAANNLSSSLSTLFTVVSESYPELHANSNFRDLQAQLQKIEGELEGARRYYNGVVKSFNTKLEVFPSNLVANGMGEDYKKRSYFELTSSDARQNVKVQF